jgi:hypothetical protein
VVFNINLHIFLERQAVSPSKIRRVDAPNLGFEKDLGFIFTEKEVEAWG